MTGGTLDLPEARLTLRRARNTDTAAVQNAYRRIIEHLGQTGDPARWHAVNHPAPEKVVNWIEAGELYVAVASRSGDEMIAGVVALDHHAPNGYERAAWTRSARAEEVLVIHALGVVPVFLRKGVAQFLVRSALEIAEEQGCTSVRLDTYASNTPAHELYTRCGFTNLGLHSLDYEGIDLDSFYLFEYLL